MSRQRAVSQEPTLGEADLLEVRARERTFEGAYVRTALNALGTGAVVLRVFSKEFFAMGFVFVVFGLAMLVLGLARRRYLLRSNLDPHAPFCTSGWYVLATAVMAIISYVALLTLVLQL